MRLLIDLQCCQNGSSARGIGRVAMALTRAMLAAARGHDIRLLLSDAFPGTILPIRRALDGLIGQDRILVCAMPPGTASADRGNAWRTRAAELLLGDAVESQTPDLLFLPSLFEGFWDAMVTTVPAGRCRSAVLLYDFIPLDQPDAYLPGTGIRAAYHRKLHDAGAADLRLAISHHIAQEAASRLGDGAVVPMPLGVDPTFRPPPPDADTAALRARYGIVRPFVLNTSPFEPRKNLEGLIAGFAALPPALRAAHQLVIVGRMNAAAQAALAAAAAARAGLPADALVLAGFVSDADLIALYGACALFAFPSLGEGFGLPVLEAMACGAPVVGSATTSIPEVVGRDDLLFDPLDPVAIGTAMARVLGDPVLTAELRGYGPARAAGFSWARAADIALDAFERCVATVTPPPPALPPASPGNRLALVSDAPLPRVTALARLLDRDFAVTPVVPGGTLDDPLAAAWFETRDFAWFARHAPGFDHILYVSSRDEGEVAGLIAAFPGVLLHDPPDDAAIAAVGSLPMPAFPRDGPSAPAPGPPPGGALAAAATEIIVTQTLPAGAGPLRDRILAAPRFLDPARIFAARLPVSVRDTPATFDDLVGLTRAFARNAALHRPPYLLLDVTGLGAVGQYPAHLLTRILAAAPEIRPVRADGAGFRCAKAAIAGRRDRASSDLPDPLVPLRAGDRLLHVVPLCTSGAMDRAAREQAMETGALPLRIEGDADAIADTLPAVLRWAEMVVPTLQSVFYVMRGEEWVVTSPRIEGDESLACHTLMVPQ